MTTTLTPEEILDLDLYDYWDNKGPDDPQFPDDNTAREILTAQGFYIASKQ